MLILTVILDELTMMKDDECKMKYNHPKTPGKPANIVFEVSQACRLLDFLLENIIGKSRNNIKSLLSHGEVSINGTIETQFDYSLQTGQRVCVTNSATRGKRDEESPDIVYEDDDFIVINKPNGLVSVATDNEHVNTAYQLVLRYVCHSNPKNKIFVLHRLDRDTSGILIFAKNEKIKNALQEKWSELATERGYVAVVEGRLKDKSGIVKSWLRQSKTLFMYSSNTPGDGLEAVTEYKVIKENKSYSMLDIQLKTGRKNQIRVHMKDLGHCVVGDKKYGATTNPFNRLGLHAYKLTIIHPFTNQTLSFNARIPDSFNTRFKQSK